MIRLARAEELDRVNELRREVNLLHVQARPCLLYTSDAADD